MVRHTLLRANLEVCVQRSETPVVHNFRSAGVGKHYFPATATPNETVFSRDSTSLQKTATAEVIEDWVTDCTPSVRLRSRTGSHATLILLICVRRNLL